MAVGVTAAEDVTRAGSGDVEFSASGGEEIDTPLPDQVGQEEVGDNVEGATGATGPDGTIARDSGRVTVATVQSVSGFDVSFNESRTVDAVRNGDQGVTAVVDVENTGGTTETQDIEFEFGENMFRETVPAVELGPGETDSFEFTFDVPEDIDFGGINMTAASDDDTTTQSVTVEGFEVTVTDTSSGITEEDSLDVDVEIYHINSEDVSETQEIALDVERADGTIEQGVTAESVSLDAGRIRTTTLTYETSVGDAPEIDVIARSDDDVDRETVDIEALPTFETTINGTNAPITAGETLEVAATIENTGDLDGEKAVELRNFAGDTVDTEVLAINASESATATFEWETSVDDDGTGDITVTGVDERDPAATAGVTIEPAAPASFTVDINETNSPVMEGEALTVTAVINNSGDRQETQPVEFLVGGEVVGSEKVTLTQNEEAERTFAYETEPVDDFPELSVEVASEDESEQRDIVVEINCEVVEFAGGDGTAASPYQVLELRQLQCLERDARHDLLDNIDATETASWNGADGFEPIGNGSEPFTGALDGNGHDVTDIRLNRSDEDGVGLFGTARDAVINDLHVDGTVLGGRAVGLLAGSTSESTLIDASSSGRSEGTERVGGLVGQAQDTTGTALVGSATVVGERTVGGIIGGHESGTLEEVSSRGNVTGVDGSVRVGGIVGYNTGILADSSSTALVSGGRGVGGIVGESRGGLLENTSTVAAVSGSTYVGGVAGENIDGEIIESSASGTTTADGNPVGGVAGRNTGSIEDSRTSAAVSGSRMVGGFVGRNSGVIVNSRATGDPVGTAEELTRVGGFVGENNGGTVVDSTATGSPNGAERIGGFVGDNRGSAVVNNSDSSGEVTGTNEVGGIAGRNDGRIENTNSTSAVAADTESFANGGGLVGYNIGTVVSSSAEGAVVGTEQLGGLVGWNRGELQDSTASGNVTGERRIGGAVGWNEGGTVSRTTATGTATGDEQVGGLVGENIGTLMQSYATATVTGETEVGGLVGTNEDGSVTETYATGNVTGEEDTGGVIGLNVAGSVTASYWDRERTTQETSDGLPDSNGLTTFLMTGDSAVQTMDGFDFVGSWSAVTDPDDYPELRQPEATIRIADQQTTGSTIVVDEALLTTVDFVIVIRNESGDVVGASDRLSRSEQQGGFEIFLDNVLEESQTITARLHLADSGSAFGDPVRRNGQVVEDQANVTVIGGDAPEKIDVTGDGQPATDTTGDGLLNDVNGDEEFNVFDVQALFSNLDTEAVQGNPAQFNFAKETSPSDVTIFDVQALFNEL